MSFHSRTGAAARSWTSHPTALNRTEVHSLQHARQVVDTITSQRFLYKILMSHSQLGDDGCIALFDLFGSAQGRKHLVSDIHLGSNNIGNAGLLAIANYLQDNVHLHSLQLPHNQFTGDASTVAAFVHAVNTSQLQTLNLASNDNLGDAFIEAFLPALHCTTLRHLNITATRLTVHSVPAIVAYLSSSQSCHLRYFSCNANQLGTPGVKLIIDTIKRHNYRLTEVNIYSNYGEVENLQEAVDEFKGALLVLRQSLNRNIHLTRETEQQALRLLRYSRPLLLDVNVSPSQSSTSRKPSCSRTSTPFPKLPTEIKEHILSFFAPTLSDAQRIRIYHYASLSSTLPPLLPRLPSLGLPTPGNTLCVPDPSGPGFGNSGKVWSVEGGGVDSGGGCAAGICMSSLNSVVCQGDQDRNTWLAAIGCETYDPDRRRA